MTPCRSWKNSARSWELGKPLSDCPPERCDILDGIRGGIFLMEFP